jgi:hypothetical protein
MDINALLDAYNNNKIMSPGNFSPSGTPMPAMPPTAFPGAMPSMDPSFAPTAMPMGMDTNIPVQPTLPVSGGGAESDRVAKTDTGAKTATPGKMAPEMVNALKALGVKPEDIAHYTTATQLMEAFNKQQKGLEALGGSQAALAKSTEKAYKPYVLDEKQAAENQKQIMAGVNKIEDLRKEEESRENEVLKLTDTYANMNLNSNRLWNDMGTGQKVMAGIGILLGGFGGTKNMGMQVINDAIDKDILAQKINLEKAGNVISQKRGLLSDLRFRLGTTEAGVNMLRAIATQSVQASLAIAAAKSNNAQVQANAQVAIGELEIKRIEAIKQTMKEAQTRIWTNQLLSDSPSETKNALQAMKIFGNEEDQKRADSYVDTLGVQGFLSGSEAQINQMKDKASSAQNIVSLTDELMKMDRNISLSEVRAKANSVIALLKLMIPSRASDSKRINEMEITMMDIIENPTHLWQYRDKTIAGIKAVQDFVVMDWQNRAGLDPAIKIKPNWRFVSPISGQMNIGKK